MKTEQQKILSDEVYRIEAKNKIMRFRYFYPSDIFKILLIDRPTRGVVGGIFSALLRQKKIRKTGNYKKSFRGYVELEYETIIK